MTDNKKLIERLRAVIDTATSDSMLVENDRVVTNAEHDACRAERDEAEAVRDLIIAALTPTDDEREALVAILEAPLTEESQGRTFSEMLADVILVRFSFRRTEVPTDDEREALLAALYEEGFSGSGEEIGTHETVIFVEYVPDIVARLGFRRTEIPEPSDDPSCICPNTLGWHTTECVASRPEPETAEAQAYSKGLTEGSDQAHRDMQGEPSDAQVLDAQNSMGRGGYWVPEEQVRAALRAAGGVR